MFQTTRVTLSAVLVAVGFCTSALGDSRSRVEIGKQAKSATAFVEVPGRGSGTGFCVHPSGWFVTNEHVIREAEESDITVVLEPSQANQRILKAAVVRVDNEVDLALLRVEGVDRLPSLPLGSIEGIDELAEVIASGFPLGRKLATNTNEYPAISVNSGSVTALRHKEGKLQFIQTDVAINFGNSGGPVLDSDGKVIGVIVSKAKGATGINQAILVSELERFLTTPDLALVPPELTRANLDQSLIFTARAASFLPNSPEPKLKLILQAGEEAAREFPMEKQDGVWTVTAVPVSQPSRPRVEIAARLAAGTISGKTNDIVIKVDDRALRLSDVRKVDWTPSRKFEALTPPKPTVLLADGQTTLQGEITGFEKIAIDLGGQTIPLDLKNVTLLTIQLPTELSFLTAAVVATVNGREVARREMKLGIRDNNRMAPADPATVPITPAELSEDKVVKKLPDGFSDVVLGGGGRYLIFHLPKLRKLAVFDFSEARITKYIPLAEDNIGFAAGLDSLVIGRREAGLLERWSLTTFENERSAPPPFPGEIGALLMGHGSNGPLVVNGQFLDLQSFRQLSVHDDKGSDRPFATAPRAVSADGTVFGGWKTNQSPDESHTFVRERNVLKHYVEGGLKHVIPGPDGKTVFTANGICAATLKRGNKDDASYGYCLPSVRGDYFVSLSDKTGFTIYLKGLNRPIAKLDKIDHGIHFDGWDRESFGPWKRVFLVPEAQVIAVLPQTNDQVVMYKFDANAALEQSGLDYLIVTSQPPHEIEAGSTLNYAIKVKSNRPKVTFTLEAAPQGMAVSPDGVVTWTPDGTVTSDQDVILTIKNASQELFHTFAVRVNR
ncbi:MAG: trypsin-like peptidase domain-containing protein [Planctomycetes bacterium]|nr:trypsin-like peptidase domain-containing protein [Planctomycetota bacterium]